MMGSAFVPGYLAVVMLVLAPAVHAAGSCMIDPVNISPNLVTSVFGKTRDLPQYSGTPHVHWGTDLQARDPKNRALGADLLAVDNGTVIGAGFWGAGYGNRLALKRDNGDIVLYNHMGSIEPKLKSGGSIGFSDSSAAVGTQTVSAGQKIGVAGGTSNHQSTNKLAIHLHLEYVTGYSGTKIRETNGGTNTTRSRYMRNPMLYMCKAIPHAPNAGPVADGEGKGGTPPVASGGVTGNKDSPSSDDQVAEAKSTQANVAPTERYGMPDAPPYQTYAGMSESQIVEAEMLRRQLDTEWEHKLTEWDKRGLWIEIARMRSVKLWLNSRIAEKRQRIEALLATNLAFRTNEYFNPRVQGAYDRAVVGIGINKVQ